MTPKSIFRLWLRYFLQGLLLMAPITITIYVIFKTFEYLDAIFPFRFPGLGLVTVISLITLVGFVGSTFIARPLLGFIDDMISRAPLVKIIYTSIKDFLEAIVGKKKRFSEPVLVKINEDSGLMKLGFITGRDLSLLGLGSEYVAVYLPHSYNFSGNLFFVLSKNIMPVKANSADIMKYVVTAGIASLGEENEDNTLNDKQ